MRLKGRLDSNHTIIREAFEAMGCSVESTAPLGKVPDLIVSLGPVTCWIEVKSRAKPLPREATQTAWRASWGGWADVCRDLGDVERIAAQMRAYRARLGCAKRNAL